MSNLYDDLQTKNVLITGAFGVLGREISKAFAAQGANLLLVDHPSALDEGFMETLYSSKSEISFYPIDLENQEELIEGLTVIKNKCPHIDVLINNAAFVGTSQGEGWNTTFENQSLESWERALRINLTAPFQLIQKLLPVLGREKNSSIINVSSIYGEFAPDWKIYEGTDMSNPAAYSASKAGLLQLTRWLSTTLSPSIRINAVSPGGILRNQHPKFVAAYVEKTPLGRMATEADVVAAILFLGSESSSYITGQNIRVNGGWGLS